MALGAWSSLGLGLAPMSSAEPWKELESGAAIVPGFYLRRADREEAGCDSLVHGSRGRDHPGQGRFESRPGTGHASGVQGRGGAGSEDLALVRM